MSCQVAQDADVCASEYQMNFWLRVICTYVFYKSSLSIMNGGLAYFNTPCAIWAQFQLCVLTTKHNTSLHDLSLHWLFSQVQYESLSWETINVHSRASVRRKDKVRNEKSRP